MKPGFAISKENITHSTAGKLELIMSLLGGEPIEDENGNVIGESAQVITPEEALVLLNSADQDISS